MMDLWIAYGLNDSEKPETPTTIMVEPCHYCGGAGYLRRLVSDEVGGFRDVPCAVCDS